MLWGSRTWRLSAKRFRLTDGGAGAALAVDETVILLHPLYL